MTSTAAKPCSVVRYYPVEGFFPFLALYVRREERMHVTR